MDAERRLGVRRTNPTGLDETFFAQFCRAIETKIKQHGKTNDIGTSLLDKILFTRFNDLRGTMYEFEARCELERMKDVVEANRRGEGKTPKNSTI